MNELRHEPLSEGLFAGNYYFVETACPLDQVLNPEKLIFTIDQSTHATLIQKNIQNDHTKVQVVKTDKKGNQLEGAELAIWDLSGNKILSFTSTLDVETFIGKLLRNHTYILTEESAPSGYKTAKPITFSIDDQGSVSINGVIVPDNRITMIDVKKTNPSEDEEEVLPPANPSNPDNPTVNNPKDQKYWENHPDEDGGEKIYGPNKDMTFHEYYVAYVLGQRAGASTGDDTPILPYILLFLGAGAAAVLAFISLKRKKKPFNS